MPHNLLTASMRPRVFPAEDPFWPDDVVKTLEASMRPRVFPAEDVLAQHLAHLGPRASMRPRVFPAEDTAGGDGNYNLPPLQ